MSIKPYIYRYLSIFSSGVTRCRHKPGGIIRNGSFERHGLLGWNGLLLLGDGKIGRRDGIRLIGEMDHLDAMVRRAQN